jgi:5-methylcytosine-specific restriction protein B
VEPAYVWRPDRGDKWAFHTVAVDWETRPAWDIDPIKKWAMTPVSDVSGEEYKRILQGVTNGPAQPKLETTEIPPDALIAEIAAIIERKGQVILYGPPGTGKTFSARRFGVYWLTSKAGEKEATTLLGDRNAFRRAEERLSTAQIERRVWWVVANPSEWNWSQGETDRIIDFRFGRLKRNYALIQPGDLVVGYSANPDKRIAAIARISKGLYETDGQQKIDLEWIANVTNVPTYADLVVDTNLAASEPLRFRNQGTLFGLTADEADYLLALLRDRDPGLPLELEDEDGIGQLTRVTFHPSYGYEDFVEGYKPMPTGTGQLDLRLVDGVFKRVCRAAQADPDRPYLMLVDEINRGNIPKIFGELITLLEKDKRGLTVVLPQSRETFAVPPNVFLLGTMNTADRSIKLLDAALRRRFAFIELMPDVEPLKGGKVGELDLATFLTGLNGRIAKTEGREKQIGHSFLLEADGQPVIAADEFARRFRYEILPLLQEYAYEDYKELESYLGRNLVDAQEMALTLPSHADELVAALHAEFQPVSTVADLQAGPPDVPPPPADEAPG